MANLKDEVLRSIHDMPDIQCMEEVMYRLYVLDKIRKGKSLRRAGKRVFGIGTPARNRSMVKSGD